MDNLSGGQFTISNTGTLTLDGSGSGRFHNHSGATFTLNGTLDLNGRDFYDQGTLVFSGGTINFNGGAYIIGKAFDASSYTILSGERFAIGTGGSLTGTGTLTVADGGILRVDVNTSVPSSLTIDFGTTATNTAVWSNTNGAVTTVNGLVNLNGGTVSAPIIVASGGQLKVKDSDGQVTISGTITNNSSAAGGGIRIVDPASDSRLILSSTGIINNVGLIVLSADSGGTADAHLQIDTGGVLNNLTGGTLLTTQDGGAGTRTISGTINNSGTIQVSYNTRFTLGNNNINNNTGGVFTIDAGATATFTAGGTGEFIVNAGSTLTIASGGTLNLNGRDVINNGGTINAIGTVSGGNIITVQTTAYDVSGNPIITSGAAVSLGTGGHIIGTGTLTIADGGTLRAYANHSVASTAIINFGTTAGSGATWTNSNNAVVTLNGTANLKKGTVSTGLTIAPGGQILAIANSDFVTLSGIVDNQSTGGGSGGIRIEDQNNDGTSAELNFTGTLNNTGSIVLTSSSNGLQAVRLDLTGGMLNNNNGGVLQTLAGDGGARQLTGTISNNVGGTIDIDADTTYQAGTLTNSGTIDVASTRTLTVASGATLANAGGAYAGTGTLDIADGATYQFTTNGTIASGFKVILGTVGGAGATWSGGATATLAGSALLNRGTVSTNLVIASGGQISAIANSDFVTLSGIVDNQSTGGGSGGIRIEDQNNDGTSAELNFTGTLNNTGSIVLTSSSNGLQAVRLDLTGGMLNNNSGGVLQTLAGAGGARQLTGTISNNVGGTIDIDANTTYQAGTLTNSGTIDVATSTTLTIASGATLANAGGAYAGTGTLDIADGATYQFTTNGTIASGFKVILGTVGGAGATWSGGATATLAGSALLNRGTVSTNLVIASGGQISAIANSDFVTLSGIVDNQSTGGGSGGIRIEDQNNDGTSAELNFTGTLNNTGSIVLTSSSNGQQAVRLDLTGGMLNNNNGCKHLPVLAVATTDGHD